RLSSTQTVDRRVLIQGDGGTSADWVVGGEHPERVPDGEGELSLHVIVGKSRRRSGRGHPVPAPGGVGLDAVAVAAVTGQFEAEVEPGPGVRILLGCGVVLDRELDVPVGAGLLDHVRCDGAIRPRGRGVRARGGTRAAGRRAERQRSDREQCRQIACLFHGFRSLPFPGFPAKADSSGCKVTARSGARIRTRYGPTRGAPRDSNRWGGESKRCGSRWSSAIRLSPTRSILPVGLSGISSRKTISSGAL